MSTHAIAAPPESAIRVDRADVDVPAMRCDRVSMDLLQSRPGPGGSWILQGRAAKATILTYNEKGGIFRERITLAELKRPEHIATVEHGPVTLEHPEPVGRVFVTP